MSMTTSLPNRVRWTTDAAGRVVVHTRQAYFYGTIYLAILLGITVAGGLILGTLPDDGFWLGGFAAFTGGFGLFFLVAGNFLFTDDKLLVDGGTVTHRRRRLIGATHEARVADFGIRTAPEDGESGPFTELAVSYADGRPSRGLWVGELPDLVRLGDELRERTGLPFDPEPRRPDAG